MEQRPIIRRSGSRKSPASRSRAPRTRPWRLIRRRMAPVFWPGAVHVSCNPFSTGNSAQHWQRYQALRQQRLSPAPGRALGFELDDKRLRRAGLDYHEYAPLKRHASWRPAWKSLGQPRVFALHTKGSQPSMKWPISRATPFCSARRAAACRPRFAMHCRDATRAPADARRLSQPEPVQHRGSGRLRSWRQHASPWTDRGSGSPALSQRYPG